MKGLIFLTLWTFVSAKSVRYKNQNPRSLTLLDPPTSISNHEKATSSFDKKIFPSKTSLLDSDDKKENKKETSPPPPSNNSLILPTTKQQQTAGETYQGHLIPPPMEIGSNKETTQGTFSQGKLLGFNLFILFTDYLTPRVTIPLHHKE